MGRVERLSTLPRRALAAAVLLLAGAGCGRERPRNVLLVTFDTTRADRLGAYGHAAAHTPHADRLAAEGVRCDDAITTAPITMPAHASLLTGLLPPAHGVRDNGGAALGDGAVTLAERLKARGYATQAFVSAIVLSRRYRLDQGFDGYDDDLWSEDEPRLFMIRDRPAARTTDRALAFLDSWHARPERERPPFFAWVHFFDPHQPYRPPAEDRRVTKDAYDAEISAADRALGRLVEWLRARGLLDDTWVVLTADHGESLGEHREKTHALFVYDATLRVPLIVRQPKVLPRGAVYAGPVRLIDVVPTLLDGLGLPGASETQGRSLLRELQGRAPPAPQPQYAESLLSELGFGMAPLYAVRSAGYKFIRAPRPELYDLRADPRELENLYERDRPRAARLDRELQALLDASAARATAPRESPLTRESEEALRALGYVAPAAERAQMAGRDPKDGIAIYAKLEDARHAAQGARWEDAERLLREILKEVPGHVSARNVLGVCLLRQGRFDEARAEYRRALQDDPGQFRVLGALGAMALLENDVASAQQHFEAALEVAPSFVEAMAHLGFLAALRGDEATARAWYEKAVAADPGFPTVHRRLGDLYYERQDWATALRHYRRTLEITPGDFQAVVQAGNSAKHLGDAAAARGYYERAQKLRHDAWVPLYNRACLEARLGNADEALAQLDRAAQKGFRSARLLERDPDFERLRADPRFRQKLAALKRNTRGSEDDDEEAGD
jgi:arylsulfatase A-like enzyme/Tfp pilus assembly protein PilF